MTHNELREQLARHGLRQRDLADLLGVTPRAVSLWCCGQRAVPGPVVAWFALLELYKRSLTTRRAKVSLV